MTAAGRTHRRYFGIGGITVCLESEFDFRSVAFKDELQVFSAAGPGDDTVTFRHVFAMPDVAGQDLGRELYRREPWAISRKDGTWHYLGISPEGSGREPWRYAVFTDDHREGTIYSPARERDFLHEYGWQSLSLFPTDQVWLAPLMADRNAALLHAAGVIVNGQGLLFVGHSSAGKSTTTMLLKEAAAAGRCRSEILCDDRMIVRRWNDGWRVHGTWSHGDVSDVSASSAPLRAVLFIQQDTRDALAPLDDRWEVRRRLFATLVRPLVTAAWWEKELTILERLMHECPFSVMHFTRSGAIVDHLLALAAEKEYSGV